MVQTPTAAAPSAPGNTPTQPGFGLPQSASATAPVTPTQERLPVHGQPPTTPATSSTSTTTPATPTTTAPAAPAPVPVTAAATTCANADTGVSVSAPSATGA